MNVLSFDVGIVHLAIIGVNIKDFDRDTIIEEEDIYLCVMIDIRDLVKECTDVECKLYHEKTICDYMTHLFQVYRKTFDEADILLVERQPITGIIAVQDLILREYRSKTILVSPNSMHKYMGINHYIKYMSKEEAYERRKEYVTKFSEKYLSGFKNFCFHERKHDMADAFCIAYYYLALKRKERQRALEEAENKKRFGQAIKNFEVYKYIESEDGEYHKEQRVGDFSQYRYNGDVDDP